MFNNIAVQTNAPSTEDQGHLIRPRIISLLEAAMEKPLTIVCAGAGYGKTWAVSDFARMCNISNGWIGLTAKDNFPPHFWDNFTAIFTLLDEISARKCVELGFPKSDAEIDLFLRIFGQAMLSGSRVLVFDNAHLITEPTVLHFLERFVHEMPDIMNVFLITRE
jgi:LuxR family maltose regulon positive regulatory protein